MLVDIKLKFIEKILVIYVVIIVSGCIQKPIDSDGNRSWDSNDDHLLEKNVSVKQTIQPQSPSNLYENNIYGFSIEYPKNWKFEENSDSDRGTIIVSFSPTQNDFVNFNIMVENVGGFTSNEYVEASKNYLSQSLENNDINYTYEGNMTIDNQEAYFFEFAWNFQGNPFQTKSVILINGKNAYIIKFSSLQDMFENDVIDFEKIISTFRFLNVTPTPKIDSNISILSEKQKLQFDIDNAPYNIMEFQENKFDCSNMAALLHDWLETQTQTKWNVDVWWGCESPSCIEGHEWLEVIGKESNYSVEVTSKKIIDHWQNSNESYREHYSYYNRHYSSLPKGSGGFIDPKENTYPKRW